MPHPFARNLTRLFGFALALLLLGSVRADVPARCVETQPSSEQLSSQPGGALAAWPIQLCWHSGSTLHAETAGFPLRNATPVAASHPAFSNCIHALEPARADAARPPPSLA